MEYAFGILDAVSQGDFTKWQVVYDIRHRRIYFRTLQKHKTKIIELSQFDFEHEKESLMLNVNTTGEGSVQEKFKKYTEQHNYDLMEKCRTELEKAGVNQLVNAEHIEYISKLGRLEVSP